MPLNEFPLIHTIDNHPTVEMNLHRSKPQTECGEEVSKEMIYTLWYCLCDGHTHEKILCITCMRAKSPQLCSTLCDPMDCRPPGSSVRKILQARILEWVAMPSSWGSSPPWDWISYVSCTGRWVLYHQHHLGSPVCIIFMCKVQEDDPGKIPDSCCLWEEMGNDIREKQRGASLWWLVLSFWSQGWAYALHYVIRSNFLILCYASFK